MQTEKLNKEIEVTEQECKSRMQTRDLSPWDVGGRKGDGAPEGGSRAVRKASPNVHSPQSRWIEGF